MHVNVLQEHYFAAFFFGTWKHVNVSTILYKYFCFFLFCFHTIHCKWSEVQHKTWDKPNVIRTDPKATRTFLFYFLKTFIHCMHSTVSNTWFVALSNCKRFARPISMWWRETVNHSENVFIILMFQWKWVKQRKNEAKCEHFSFVWIKISIFCFSFFFFYFCVIS